MSRITKLSSERDRIIYCGVHGAEICWSFGKPGKDPMPGSISMDAAASRNVDIFVIFKSTV
jgi:hypothetical protein